MKLENSKILFTLRIVLSACVIVLSVLQLCGVYEKATYISTPLMGIVLLISSVQEWKQRRSVAIFGLCAAVFIFICTGVILLLG